MDPITIWTWSLIAGGIVIVVVACLLLAIIAIARRIDAHALEIWKTGKNIAANTVSIWMLDRTNQLAQQILQAALSIDANLKALAKKLVRTKGA
jgi:hypothetical protein